jgi:Alpha-N-acetylglucosaminidase (NAGLU) C-terminal domain
LLYPLLLSRNPTPSGAETIPGGPIDYASKHWHGLIVPYYTKRSEVLLNNALVDEGRGQPLNNTEIKRLFAQHAYDWTTSMSFVAFDPASINQAPIVSSAMIGKYSHWFESCDSRNDNFSAMEIKGEQSR